MGLRIKRVHPGWVSVRLRYPSGTAIRPPAVEWWSGGAAYPNLLAVLWSGERSVSYMCPNLGITEESRAHKSLQ